MTADEIENAESEAAHRAIEVYFAVLGEKLDAAGVPVMKVLGGTTHVHGSVCLGDATGIVEFTIRFDDSPTAVGYALTMAKQRGKL